ncbi:transposase [Hoeflea sp. WL0058]|uniref:Transposase n=1 Tax=Flavimaribacter sediminis TaxID=2865987 RepID=A0AAE3D203_9HYPH|nr:transposase [Flavimaribacter sediminis]
MAGIQDISDQPSRTLNDFAALLGPKPKKNASGGTDRLRRPSNKGNRHLRNRIAVSAYGSVANSSLTGDR